VLFFTRGLKLNSDLSSFYALARWESSHYHNDSSWPYKPLIQLFLLLRIAKLFSLPHSYSLGIFVSPLFLLWPGPSYLINMEHFFKLSTLIGCLRCRLLL